MTTSHRWNFSDFFAAKERIESDDSGFRGRRCFAGWIGVGAVRSLNPAGRAIDGENIAFPRSAKVAGI